MILLTSAAYVGREFQVELGILPPAFLPISNRRLFDLQIAQLKKVFPDELIWLSLPDSFVIDPIDEKRIYALGGVIVRVPDNLSLSKSILYAINFIGDYNSSLKILHGDTLIFDLPEGGDIIAISESYNFYSWEKENCQDRGKWIWCGFFSFNNIPLLARELIKNETDFELAVRAYGERQDLNIVEIKKWLDFGHVNTYYKSRSKITTERSFNQLSIKNGVVTKKGFPSVKIEMEANWFKKIPNELRVFLPQIISAGFDINNNFSYSLEYVCATPLNEALVYGRNPLFFWDKIFSHCKEWFSISGSIKFDLNDIDNIRRSMIERKTWDRLAEMDVSGRLNIKKKNKLNGREMPSFHDIAKELISISLDQPIFLGVVHGDMCFSNIIYDSRSDRLKLIDPRGMSPESNEMIYGDMSYDYSKLMHSVIGLYDFIIAGMYHIDRQGNDFIFYIEITERVLSIQDKFINTEFFPARYESIYAQMILLFISMLPLHSDNLERQNALMANALRLYSLHFLDKV